ncbi:MAG: type II toxin-antitoxin system RelE/ParE family toxin [Anaerolineaceae bacterium]|nr:type II toxin-antitoxin system RelE/ParE family toxin [Anaerolineaceae bacterium]
MSNHIRLRVVFYKTATGNEPVREWLKSLSNEDRKTIGEDVKTVQFGWPLGMPVVRKLDMHLWEVRSRLQNRTARIFFTVEDNVMVLLHGFIKKTQKISKRDLELAKKRTAQLRG